MRHVLKFLPAVLAAAAMTGAVSASASGRPAHAAVGSTTDVAATARIAPVIACGQLTGHDFSQVPDATTVILTATQVTPPPPAPAVCDVVGYIAPQERLRLTLPVSGYTGRYLQRGCGGLCGLDYLGSAGSGGAKSTAATTSCAAAATAATVDGGAMASGTDNQGHIGGDGDGLWARDDPALRVSFGYTSEHAMAQAAKAIITAYYGKPPAYSYDDGCSGGGREALVEAQRYPHDFNGILAGAPGNVEAQLLGIVPAWLIAANTGTSGRQILTSDKLPAMHAAVVAACGDASGLIEDPRSCDFDPASIQCPAGRDDSSCLTPAQVTVTREFYLGPSDGHGLYLYPGGEPYGSELAWNSAATDLASDTRWPRDTFAYQIGTTYLEDMAYWHNPPASFQLSDLRFTLADYLSLPQRRLPGRGCPTNHQPAAGLPHDLDRARHRPRGVLPPAHPADRGAIRDHRPATEPDGTTGRRGTWPQHPLPLGRPVPARQPTVVRHRGHEPGLHAQPAADPLHA